MIASRLTVGTSLSFATVVSPPVLVTSPDGREMVGVDVVYRDGRTGTRYYQPGDELDAVKVKTRTRIGVRHGRLAVVG